MLKPEFGCSRKQVHLDMAVRRCKPPKGLIFHSDRGVQYAAVAFRERLESYGIQQSMSRKGDPYQR